MAATALSLPRHKCAIFINIRQRAGSVTTSHAVTSVEKPSIFPNGAVIVSPSCALMPGRDRVTDDDVSRGFFHNRIACRMGLRCSRMFPRPRKRESQPC